ncbi:MAG: 16S rRNA (guanine(966)-N(2))-methyltransferase RsmD [Dehalococcoidia bacterium]
MRISGGSARGRPLVAAPGTRPTTDRVRQAIFNALAAIVPFEGAGLDLYAGSGALGIEALSRGLDSCTFVDSRSAACKAIKANLQAASLADRAKVVCADASRAVGRIRSPLAIVFCDPPYADDGALAAIEGLGTAIGDDTVIVLEHSGRREPPPELAGLRPIRSKRYGDSAVTFYGREA